VKAEGRFTYPFDRLFQFEKVVAIDREYTSVYLSTYEG
jgi:hypothetical protein